jgi:hypothetical protein
MMNGKRMEFLTTLCCALALGCGGSLPQRVGAPVGAVQPPHIDGLVDLGAYTPAASGRLDQSYSDERISPGEWLVVVGSSLSTIATKVSIDDKSVPLAGHLEGGSVLIRVPVGLTPRSSHQLTVQTPLGVARHPLELSSFVVVGDLGGNELRFLRVAPHQKDFWTEDIDPIALDDLGRVALSSDHSFVHAIAYKPESAGYAWLRVHLAAPDGPAVDQRGHYPLNAGVRDMLLDDAGRTYVLTGQGLFIFQGRALLGTTAIGPNPPLPDSQWAPSHLVLFNGGKNAAALEVFSNQLLLFDIADVRRPQLVQSFRIGPATEPVSIALEAVATTPTELWALAGANQRTLGTALRSALDVRGWFDPNSSPKAPDWHQLEARLLRIGLASGQLQLLDETKLPRGFVPLSLGTSPAGFPWVSGVGSQWFEISNAEQPGLRDYADAFFKTAEVGHLLEVRPGAKPVASFSGMLLCFNPVHLPGDTLPLFSAVRIGPRFFPPSVGLDWAIEVGELQSEHIRGLDFKSWIPPYEGPIVLVQ